MSDTAKFNIFVGCLLVLAVLVIIMLQGCSGPQRGSDCASPTFEQRLAVDDSVIQKRARARVEQWKREGWK